MFRIVILNIFVTFMSGLISLVHTKGFCTPIDLSDFTKKCEAQTSYSLTKQQSLQVDVYYDAAEGGLEPDAGYIRTTCKARAIFKHVTFSFFVGVSVEKNKNGKLECLNKEAHKNEKYCTYAILDACASKLVPDFAAYVCCNYEETSEARTVEECFQRQNTNLDEFDKCASLQHPNIKPDEILLENAKKAHAAYPKHKCYPLLGFNGKTDECARYIFYDNPEKVICAMLAKGVEDKCNI